MASLPRFGYPAALDVIDTINTLAEETEAALSQGGGGSYTLPPATASTLGGVKVGAGLSVESDGTLSATGGGGGGSYTLPPATSDTLGGVKIGSGVSVSGDGTISVDVPEPYTLPVASASALGGVKVGEGLSVAEDGTLSATGGGGSGYTPFILGSGESVTCGNYTVTVNISDSAVSSIEGIAFSNGLLLTYLVEGSGGVSNIASFSITGGTFASTVSSPLVWRYTDFTSSYFGIYAFNKGNGLLEWIDSDMKALAGTPGGDHDAVCMFIPIA